MDGDGVSIKYNWLLDGHVMASGPTLFAGQAIGSVTLECVAEASDGSEVSTGRSGQVLVGHSAPQVQGLSFDTAEVMTDTILGANFSVLDFDKDVVEVEYEWSVNGSPAGNELRLNGDVWFEAGDSIELTATPVDGFDRGVGVTISAVVADAPVVAPEVSMASDRTREGDDLVCAIDVPGYDPDGDAVSHSIQWMLDGAPFDGDVYDGEVAGDTIDGADTIEEQQWECIVTASSGSSDAMGTATRHIKAAAETAEVAFSIEDVEGADDTCTGAEAVVDGSQVQPGAGREYLSMRLPEVDPKGVTEVTVTVEAAACNADEGSTATLQWVIVGPKMMETVAEGSAELSVPADCSCPDVGEVVEMTAAMDGVMLSSEYQMIFTVEAESFGLISDADDNVASVVFTY